MHEELTPADHDHAMRMDAPGAAPPREAGPRGSVVDRKAAKPGNGHTAAPRIVRFSDWASI